jgi:hypothetical protein
MKMLKICWSWALFQSLFESVCSNVSFLKVSRLGLAGFRAISFRILGQVSCYWVAVNCFRWLLGVSSSGTFLSQWKECRLKRDIQLPSWFCEYFHFIFQKEHLDFASSDHQNPRHYFIPFPRVRWLFWLLDGLLNIFISTSIFSYQVESSISKGNN